MSQIFLPLRSNAAWFATPETRYSFEKRLKNYIVIYDEIILQNGRFSSVVGKNGSFDTMMPLFEDEEKRKKISYLQPGQTFQISIKGQDDEKFTEILGGEAKVRYEVDFYPIILESGLLNEDYIKWVNSDLSQKDKNIAKRDLKLDKDKSELDSILPNNYFQRKKIIESYYIDSLFSYLLNLPFSVDYQITPFIRYKNDEIKNKYKPELNSFIYNWWISLNLPYFGDLPWEEVHKIRSSKAGEDFRDMLQRVSHRVSKYMPEIKDYKELKDIVNKEIIQELIQEILHKQSTPQKAAFNIAMNFVPLNSIYGTGKEIVNYMKDSQSWVHLIHKYN